MYSQPSSPSLLKMAGMAILAILPIVYGVIALNTGDLLWISPVFSAEPDAIVIHCYGNDVPVEPGSRGFTQITNLVNGALSGTKRWDQLSLSEATYQDYLHSSEMMVLELDYSQPVRVHSQYKFFSDVDTLLIPLDGRHASTNAVFALRQGKADAGSMHIESNAPLVEYMAAENLCRKP